MEKSEGFPEKSASEQDLRRERPRPPPSEGSESENLLNGAQGNRPPVRSTEEMMRAPAPTAVPPTPCPPPPRYRLVPARDNNSGRVVVREPLTEYTLLNLVQQPPRWPRADSYSEFVARALSSSWPFTPPPSRRRGRLRQLPERQPRCVTCATAVSTMVVHVAPEKAMQVGESSGGAGTSSERLPFPSIRAPTVDLSIPDQSRRSLRNDGLKLDLNAPPPDSDSEDEDQK